MHFAKDCDYLMNMVDNLLDTLTGGQHSKTLKLVRSGELLRDPEEEEADKQNKESKSIGTGSNSPASGDKANIKLQDKSISSNDKSQEKTVATNGNLLAQTVIVANGTDAARCNGSSIHG